jgi:hypothetical protein
MNNIKSQRYMEKAGFKLENTVQSERFPERISDYYRSKCGRWTAVWCRNPISKVYPNLFVFDSLIMDFDYDSTAPMQGTCVMQVRIPESKILKVLAILGIK